ncbi:hypothetical protein D3C86_2123960 [compost metagenome]
MLEARPQPHGIGERRVFVPNGDNGAAKGGDVLANPFDELFHGAIPGPMLVDRDSLAAW